VEKAYGRDYRFHEIRAKAFWETDGNGMNLHAYEGSRAASENAVEITRGIAILYT
jgi:hypothetical protein